jgi:hypothetical protein
MDYEGLSEETPFTPEQEAAIRQLTLDRAPGELASLEGHSSDSDAFVYLPKVRRQHSIFNNLLKRRPWRRKPFS